MEHKDAIIACFKNVRLLLTINGLEDYLLKVRDCLNLTVGDQQKALESTTENLAVIDKDGESIIEVDSNEDSLFYTAKEVVEGIAIKQEDENDVTTNSGVKLDERFNLDAEDESDFDDDIDGDKDMQDENMQLVFFWYF